MSNCPLKTPLLSFHIFPHQPLLISLLLLLYLLLPLQSFLQPFQLVLIDLPSVLGLDVEAASALLVLFQLLLDLLLFLLLLHRSERFLDLLLLRNGLRSGCVLLTLPLQVNSLVLQFLRFLEQVPWKRIINKKSWFFCFEFENITILVLKTATVG